MFHLQSFASKQMQPESGANQSLKNGFQTYAKSNVQVSSVWFAVTPEGNSQSKYLRILPS